MIYEFRSYTIKPTKVPEVIKRFGDAYQHRAKYSELAAFWYTEIGPLNQIIHVWPYENLNERARIRAEAAKDKNWPPPIAEFLERMDAEIFIPFPFAPELKPGTFGPIFEMRSYSVKVDGGMAKTMERWEEKLPGRLELSPLCFAGYTELGPLHKYIHVWPYPSLDERARIRKTAVEQGKWPPAGGDQTLVSQENKIMLAAPFSPVQ